jgi:rubredoxin
MSEQEESLLCPVCGFKADSKKGLAGHMRLSHQYPTKQEGFKDYVDGVIEKQDEAWERRLKALEDAVKSSKEATIKPDQETKDTLKHIKECPACCAEVKKAVLELCYNEILMTMLKDLNKAPVKCKECGFIMTEALGRDLEACPNCGAAGKVLDRMRVDVGKIKTESED